jgi:cytochrome P450
MANPPLDPSTPTSAVALSTPPRAGLPLVGSLPFLARDPLNFLLDSRAKLGDIFTLDLGVRKCICLNHPRHAQHVLREHTSHYAKGGPIWESIRKLIGNGLPASEGEFWLRQRRMMQPHFHKERLANVVKLMVEAIDESMDLWEQAADSGEPLDTYHAFSRMTMNVVVKALFGADMSTDVADMVGHKMDYAVKHILASLITTALPKWMPVPGRERNADALNTMDKVIYEVIARRRSRGSSDNDLLGMLIDAVDSETGGRMTDAQLRDEALALFMAGYETTSTTLAFACATIAERPDIAQALREEFDRVVGDQKPDASHIMRMPLSLLVMQEVTRLYPATYFIARVCVKDDVIDGFRIPAGTPIGVMAYVINRHPEFWQEPAKFDPWRFTPERSVGRHPLAWISFGTGQRICIGKEFSLMESQVALARLMSRFEFETVPGRPVKPELAATIRPKGGAWLRLRRRKPRPVAEVA